jgi:hypothetical protein
MSTVINAEYWDIYNRTVGDMQNAPSEFDVDSERVDRHLAGVSKDIHDWANRTVIGFTEIGRTKKLHAEEILTKAMSSLTEAERYQFLLNNLIEGLKHGDTPLRMIERYNEIGLTDIPIEPPVRGGGVMPNPQITPPQSASKPVRFIRKIFNGLASICGHFIKIAIAMAQAISEHVKIKFKPVVGSTSFLPSLSFLLEPELEGEIKVSACFEGVQAIVNRFAISAF